MGKLAPTHLPLVSVFIICVLLNFRTGAAFFIEVHDNDGYYTGISLYECNLPNAPPSTQRTSSAVTALLPAPTINQDISCDEIGDKRKKRQVYLTTNFFLVLRPQLPNRRRIILGSRPQLPNNIFVGVTVVSEGPADCPPLLSNLDARNVDTINQQCVQGLSTVLLGSENFGGLFDYMNLANVFQFASESMVNRFTAFTAIVDNVQKHYMDNVVRGKQSSELFGDAAGERQRRTRSERREQAKNIVKKAARLLAHKLIDPCFVTSYLRQINQPLTMRGTPINIGRTVDTMCHNHCLLLSAALRLTLSSVRSAVCGRSLEGGACDGKKCMCEKLSRGFLCTSGPKSVPMVACSNDLRMGIRDFLNVGV